MNLEIVNETNYQLTKEDLFIIEELSNKIVLGLFTSIVFKLNKKVHIDFLDFKEGIVIICKTENPTAVKQGREHTLN